MLAFMKVFHNVAKFKKTLARGDSPMRICKNVVFISRWSLEFRYMSSLDQISTVYCLSAKRVHGVQKMMLYVYCIVKWFCK